MRTRTRFAILFACIGAAVMAIGIAAIYSAVGRDAARRLPAEAEALLGTAAKRAIDGSAAEADRLEAATQALLDARSLLAEGKVMEKDAIVRLALEVAAILAAVLGAAAFAFFLLSRLITRGLDGLAAGARAVQRDRALRFPASADRDLDSVSRALNELLDLAAEQERRLGEAARLEGWREVASFLAHQLKNPLAALRIAAQNAGLTEEAALARESLGIVLSEADRLASLINRFRDLAPSGLESYNASVETDLGALLGACASRAEIAGARVVLEGPSLAVAGDRTLLEQAFWNLFANSIEAGATGAPVEIQVRVEAEGGEALVAITDSNSGMNPAILARLGRDRVTTKPEGTGLGLILVRRIFSALGGSLELYQAAGGGLGARARLALARPKGDAP